MSFGDGIASVQVEREEKYGTFWAWVLLLKDFVVIGACLCMFLAVGVAALEILADWISGSDTLAHVISTHLVWLWHLLGRIV